MLNTQVKLVEELTDTLNDEDVSFADCVIKIVETADNLRKDMEN